MSVGKIKTFEFVSLRNNSTSDDSRSVNGKSSEQLHIVCDSSMSNKVFQLVSGDFKDCAKFVGETAELINDFGLPVGKLKEYGHVSQLLAPFSFVQKLQTLERSFRCSDLELVDRSFWFSFIKTSVDTFKAVAYLTSSVAMQALCPIVSIGKHYVAALQDLVEIFEIVKKEDKKLMGKDGVELFDKIFDLIFRLIATEWISLSYYWDMGVKVIGFSLYLIEKLYFELGSVKGATELGEKDNKLVYDIAKRAI